MRLRFKLASVAALLGMAFTLVGAETAPWKAATPAQRETESNITMLTARVLGRSQFSHQPLDRELAGRFLDGYLDALDGSHSLFRKSDLEEFAGYRETLARATLRNGDTSAAWDIFGRYLKRLGERTDFLTNALQTETLTFTNHDSYVFGRDHAPYPTDQEAARALWRQQLRFDYLQEKLNAKKPAEIVKTLSRRYARLLQTARHMSREEVLGAYLNALAHIYDPHSDYMGHEEMDSFAISMNLSLTGIGALLGVDDGYCKIRELVPGGPALRSGQLKPGDRIVAVAQDDKEPVDMVEMPLPRAVELIRGPKGTVVNLTVIPAGSADDSVRKVVRIVREEIKLEDQEAKARVIDLPTGKDQTLRVGVIDLPSFYADFDGPQEGSHRSATADVALLLEKLKKEGIKGLVLDLRRNGGGSLEEAINLSGLFLGRGPVVQIRDPAGGVEVQSATNTPALYDGPMVTLTSRFSASASEILAGALQDYGRAVIVGDSSTFGKGTVQSLFSLGPVMDASNLEHIYDPGSLKITIRKFYRPSGASTQRNGVSSDIVLPSASDASDISESALKDPLPWDTVPPASFSRLNLVAPALSALKEKSAKRVADNKEFLEVRGDLARLEKRMTTKSVSLDEAERRKEMEEIKAEEKRRRKEDAARRLTAPKMYAVTLENLSKPGLPAPMTFTNKVAAAASAPADTTVDGEDDSLASGDFGPLEDILLTEAEHILADYIPMLQKPSASTLSQR